MSPGKNKRSRSEYEVEDQTPKSGFHSINQMQIDDSIIGTEGSSSIPKEFSISMVKSIIEEEEENFRTNLLEKETAFKQLLYEEQKKAVEELMECESSKEMNNWLKLQFEKISDYVEILEKDSTAIKERQICHEMTFLTIKKQDEEIAQLLKEIKEKENQKAKREAEIPEKVATLEKIIREKEEVKADIVLYEKRIQNREASKAKFDELEDKLKEKEQEKLEVEKRIEEWKMKIKDLDETRVAKKEKYEVNITEKRLKIEKLKMEIAFKKKKAEELKRTEEFIENLNQKENILSQDRVRREENQREELRKEKLKLNILEEKFDAEELKSEEFCKANGIKFIGLKQLEIPEIKENLVKLKTMVDDKKIEFENSTKELEGLKKSRGEEIRTKQEKLKDRRLLVDAQKLKNEEQTKISAELHQKISEAQRRIEEQEREKQEILARKENALARQKELSTKIEELKVRNAEKRKEILMLEDMEKSALDVNKHILEALKNKEALQAEVAEYKKNFHAKVAEIDKRCAEKSKVYENKINELQCQIEQNVKLLSKKKREGKKREQEEMQQERNLREKLSNLEEEIEKVDAETEIVSTMTELNTQQNLKSILKSPKDAIPQPKSPKKVKFEI